MHVTEVKKSEVVYNAENMTKEERPDKIELKKIIKRVKKEVQNRTEQLVSMSLHNSNSMKEDFS